MVSIRKALDAMRQVGRWCSLYRVPDAYPDLLEPRIREDYVWIRIASGRVLLRVWR